MKKYIFSFLLIMMICCQPLFAQRILTLEESKRLALKNNVESKNSQLETKAARQIKKSALTRYFPMISAGGLMFNAQKNLMEMETQGGNLPVYDGNPANLRNATQFAYFPSSTMGLMKEGTIGYINAVQPVFAGGRIFNGNRFASLGKDASVLKEKLITNKILLKTEEQYWQIVSLEEKSKTIMKYEEMLNSLYRQVEDAYNAGLIMKNDVLKVRLKLNEIRLNKTRLENGTTLAKMAFCQHIGIPYDSTLVLNDVLTTDDLPQNIYVENSAAFKNRAEYNLLELSVKAEKLQTRMKIGEYLPQAGIGVGGMYMKFDEGEKRTFGMIFGTVSVPISGWWGGAHELQERCIKEQIAKNNFKNNSELLLLQMEKAWQDLNDAYKQYLLSEESRAQAAENMKVNDDSYKNGLINVSDLLEAQALLQQAHDQLTDAKSTYLVKKTTYLQITGR